MATLWSLSIRAKTRFADGRKRALAGAVALPPRIVQWTAYHQSCRCLSSSAATFHQVLVSRHSAGESSQSSDRAWNDPELADTTKLADELIARTRSLMDEAFQKGSDVPVRHVVAFSGGIDSSLVLALLMEASKIDGGLTSSSSLSSSVAESVHAVIGVSPAVPRDQLLLAQNVADHIGTPLVEVATTEGSDDTYIANNGQACLACKTHLYTALEAVAEHVSHNSWAVTPTIHNHSTNSQQKQLYRHQLYNGTNADDVQDSTRVGLIAARNFAVQSPLMLTTKQNVRRVAKHLGLPNWNVAASPCLRSRLALGVEATQDHLQRIEAAESFVRRQLEGIILETTNLRVRLLAGNCAMLEIDAELLPHVESYLHSENNGSSWEPYFVQTLGFASVNARAFRSGSVAATTTNGNMTNTNDSTRNVKPNENWLREAVG